MTKRTTTDQTMRISRHSRLPPILRALGHRNFQLFFGGQLISLCGTWMQTVAQSWLVYRLTGSALLLGTVAFAGQVPAFLLSPAGGTIADRYNRHRIVVGTQTAAMVLAFILAALTLTRAVRVWHVIVLAALLGVVYAFDIPTRQAFLVDMVGKEDLLNAIALNSSMFNGARVLGPAVAGVLVATIGEGWCFFANAVSYIAVIAALLMMKLGPLRATSRLAPALGAWPPGPGPGLAPFAATAPVAQRTRSPLEDIVEGFRFVWRTAPIRALLLLLGLASLVASPYTVLMPIFADQVLHGGARGLGLLMGSTGLGALLGALSLAMRSGLRGLGRWVAVASTCFGASLILFAYSRWFWVSVALLVPAGFCMMFQMSSSNTLIQAMVPDRLRGRVMAVYSMMFMGMAPLGAIYAGAVAHTLGAPLTTAIGGAAMLAGSAAFISKLPAIRGEARQLIIAQGMAGPEPAEEMTVRSTPSER